MSGVGEPRPWWASEPDATELARDDDPVERYRDARRGPTTEATDGPQAVHDPDLCGVCPICAGLRLLADTNPELLGHLTQATRHLVAAARVLLDPDRDRPGGDADRFTRIDVE